VFSFAPAGRSRDRNSNRTSRLPSLVRGGRRAVPATGPDSSENRRFSGSRRSVPATSRAFLAHATALFIYK